MLQFDDALQCSKASDEGCTERESSCSKYDLYTTSLFFKIDTVHPLNIPPVMGLLR